MNGVKNGMNNFYKEMCNMLLNQITYIIDKIIENGWQNEQVYLDFVDNLNKQSVRI